MTAQTATHPANLQLPERWSGSAWVSDLPGIGHTWQLEVPDQVRERMTTWLGDHDVLPEPTCTPTP